MENKKNEVQDNFNEGVFTFYDCILKQFEIPFIIEQTKLYDYLKTVVNSVESKFYGHENNYYIVKIAEYNKNTAEIENIPHEQIATLDTFIDDQKRNLQTIIQTLNYLPTGYFKMPTEMKQQIQKDIDTTIKEYVENYVVPDLDTNQILNKLKAENAELKEKVKNL